MENKSGKKQNNETNKLSYQNTKNINLPKKETDKLDALLVPPEKKKEFFNFSIEESNKSTRKRRKSNDIKTEGVKEDPVESPPQDENEKSNFSSIKNSESTQKRRKSNGKKTEAREEEEEAIESVKEAKKGYFNSYAKKVKVKMMNFSLGGSGSNALLRQTKREPLLITELHPLLRRLLTPWYQNNYLPNLGWCTLHYASKLTQRIFIIVDGVSLSTFQDLHMGNKKASKLYHKMLDEGNILEYKGRRNYESYEISEHPRMKKQKLNISQEEIQNTDSENISHTVNRWLSRVARLDGNYLEIVAPSVYGHDVVDDLLRIRICQEYMDEKLIETVPNIVSLYNKFKGNDEEVEEKTELVVSSKSTIKIEIKNRYDAYKYWPRFAEGKENDVKSDNYDRRQLIMKFDELVSCKYPIPSEYMKYDELEIMEPDKEKYDQFVATKNAYIDVSATSPMFSLDCEFVKVGPNEFAVAIVAIVNESGATVFHSYVKPSLPVKDYLTEFSSVTHENLKDVEVTLADVQMNIREKLPPDAILVGQSLYNDLDALQMYHPYIIDTSLIFNLSGGKFRNDKLKTLTKAFLNRDIQSADLCLGHDPTEDAVASLDLVKLKLQHEFSYGNKLLDGYIPKPKLNATVDMKVVNILDVRLMKNLKSDRVKIYSTESNTPRWKKSLKQPESGDLKFITQKDNYELVTSVRHNMMESHFIFVHLEAEKAIQSTKVKQRVNALTKLDEQLSSIHSAMCSGGIFTVLFAGSSVDTPKEDISNAMLLTTIK